MGLEDGILAQRWDLGHRVGIWASRLGFGPPGWDMGLEAKIWAWRLGEKEEKEEEKIPMCESKGHRPLWGRCPAPTLNFKHNLPKQGTGTADHLTLLRLLFLQFAK